MRSEELPVRSYLNPLLKIIYKVYARRATKQMLTRLEPARVFDDVFLCVRVVQWTWWAEDIESLHSEISQGA